MATRGSDGPFLQLVARCKCGRLLSVRPSLSWVNWMRDAARALGRDFGGPAFVHTCRDCRAEVRIDASDLYLDGVLEEAS